LSVSLSVRSYGREPLAHSHAHHQLVLPLSGELELDIEGRGARLQRGRLASISGGERHSFSAKGANRFLVVDLPSPLAETFLPAAERFLPFSPAAARRALRLARAEVDLGEVQAWLADMLGASHGGDALHRIAAAMAVMQSRPAAHHPTADLARAVGLGRSRFHQLFVAATGVTPQRWLGDLRLDVAERLLRHGQASLAEIALICGFSEQSALTRALQRERGLTPGELRQVSP
jgi:AraC-like DNA-binding protein